MLFLGIDPGASGGIAMLDGNSDDGWTTSAVPMPATERDVWEVFDVPMSDVFACIEKVGGYVAGNPTPGSAMFTFGRGVGLLHGFLIALSVPYEEVPPRTWQKALGISPRGKDESKGSFKNRIKAVAQKLFPGAGVTLKTCDALLLAEYCRRKRTGTL